MFIQSMYTYIIMYDTKIVKKKNLLKLEYI